MCRSIMVNCYLKLSAIDESSERLTSRIPYSLDLGSFPIGTLTYTRLHCKKQVLARADNDTLLAIVYASYIWLTTSIPCIQPKHLPPTLIP